MRNMTDLSHIFKISKILHKLLLSPNLPSHKYYKVELEVNDILILLYRSIKIKIGPHTFRLLKGDWKKVKQSFEKKMISS